MTGPMVEAKKGFSPYRNHKVIDEKFTDSAQYKETEEGELKE